MATFSSIHLEEWILHIKQHGVQIEACLGHRWTRNNGAHIWQWTCLTARRVRHDPVPLKCFHGMHGIGMATQLDSCLNYHLNCHDWSKGHSLLLANVWPARCPIFPHNLCRWQAVRQWQAELQWNKLLLDLTKCIAWNCQGKSRFHKATITFSYCHHGHVHDNQ